MLGRGVKVNMQLRSIAFHNTAAIIPTIALKIVWKESKLPNCCIWDQKMFEIPKILFFFILNR